MPKNPKVAVTARQTYRPEKRICPRCGQWLKRSHTLWHKVVVFPTGPKHVESWLYRCPNRDCSDAAKQYVSTEAETLHLKYRRYSRELIVKIGYRRFWLHQTMYEIHEWLTHDLRVQISDRQVLNLIGDFLALLRAAQPSKVRSKLREWKQLVIGIDGIQPEKGNQILYLVREVQSGQILMAESLDEGSHEILSTRLLEPLKGLANELGLTWQGVISDAQASIRLAVANSLPGVPHQVCQFHCLRDAGKLTFEADRGTKTRLKVAYRRAINRLRNQIQRWPSSDGCRSIALDYAHAVHSTLLQDGVAPFELGGVSIFEALEEIASSLARCQKNASMCFCAASWRW
jgi:hypothetical protein